MVHKENPRTNSQCLILAEGLILLNPCLISIWNVCQHFEQCGEEVFNVLNCEATRYENFFSLSTAGSSVWKMKLKSYATDKDFLVGIFLFENSFVQSRLNLLLKLGGGWLKSAYVIISGYIAIVNINGVFMQSYMVKVT